VTPVPDAEPSTAFSRNQAELEQMLDPHRTPLLGLSFQQLSLTMCAVGLADRIRAYAQGGATSIAPVAAPAGRNVAFTFKLREFDTSADDGTPIYGRGWVVRDEASQALSDQDELLDDCGVLIFKVAGVTFVPRRSSSRASTPETR
jgi:hypothetical protein